MEERENTLAVLANAISDVGLWTWWAAELPDFFQLEFSRTMLYFPPKRQDVPPNTTIAIQFKKPISVSFLHRKGKDELPENWPELFHQDQLQPFSIDHESFSFQLAETRSIAKQAKKIDTIYGKSIDSADFGRSTIQLGFWAGQAGCIVSAEQIRLVNHDGAFSLDKIPSMHQQWWDYWRAYWRVRDTCKAMSYDSLCEITIPAGEIK